MSAVVRVIRFFYNFHASRSPISIRVVARVLVATRCWKNKITTLFARRHNNRVFDLHAVFSYISFPYYPCATKIWASRFTDRGFAITLALPWFFDLPRVRDHILCTILSTCPPRIFQLSFRYTSNEANNRKSVNFKIQNYLKIYSNLIQCQSEKNTTQTKIKRT